MISSAAVMSAVYHLGDRYQRNWPTSAAIADYLEVPEVDVRAILLDLRRKRLFRDRRRRNQRQWMPWEAV